MSTPESTPESTVVDVQPREIVDAATRALLVVGADPAEARVAGRAVLVAERRHRDGLELLTAECAHDWSRPDARPTTRAAIIAAESRRCGFAPDPDTPTVVVPDAVRDAVREYVDGDPLDDAVPVGPVRMTLARRRAFRALADRWLVALDEPATTTG